MLCREEMEPDLQVEADRELEEEEDRASDRDVEKWEARLPQGQADIVIVRNAVKKLLTLQDRFAISLPVLNVVLL